MKWARKKSSSSSPTPSLITRVFPITWFSKFKKSSSKSTKNNSSLDFPSPNSSVYREGRFYSVDEDDAYWRISFGGGDRIQPRRSTAAAAWQDSDKDLENHIFSDFKRLGLSEAEPPAECRNFSEMVYDIKRMRESRGKERVRSNSVTEREISIPVSDPVLVSPIESRDRLVSNSRKPVMNPRTEPDRKLKVIKMRIEPKPEARVKKTKETTRTCPKAYSPRTECKIRALEEMKKARARTRTKKKALKERVVNNNTVFDSFAIAKSSLDPHRDFKDSMVEMIREKGIGHPDDLEELLACYLALNRDEYHDLIIDVFRQVWIELKGAFVDC